MQRRGGRQAISAEWDVRREAGEGEGGGSSSRSVNTLGAAPPLPAFTSPTKSHNGVLCFLGWLRRLLVMLRAMWGVERMKCLCVCVSGGLARSLLQRHTARLHVPSPQPASGHTKGMMSCLANNKSAWARLGPPPLALLHRLYPA